MSLYALFKAYATQQEETEFLKIYRMTAEGTDYKVVITKKRANNHTVIHCAHNRIAWEQVPLFPRIAGRNYGEKVSIYTAVPDKSCVTIFVVRGNPNGFVGLDEGVFRCANRFEARSINVMSYRRFMEL